MIALLFEGFNSPLTSTNKKAFNNVSPLWSLKFPNGNLNVLLLQGNFFLSSDTFTFGKKLIIGKEAKKIDLIEYSINFLLSMLIHKHIKFNYTNVENTLNKICYFLGILIKDKYKICLAFKSLGQVNFISNRPQ